MLLPQGTLPPLQVLLILHLTTRLRVSIELIVSKRLEECGPFE